MGDVTWLAAPGRPVVCRREGCREPAVVETLALCEAHLIAYKAEVAHVLADMEQANGKRHARARVG